MKKIYIKPDIKWVWLGLTDNINTDSEIGVNPVVGSPTHNVNPSTNLVKGQTSGAGTGSSTDMTSGKNLWDDEW